MHIQPLRALRGIATWKHSRFTLIVGSTLIISSLVTVFTTPSVGSSPSWNSAGVSGVEQGTTQSASASLPKGYWLVAKDGGVFSFGDAQFYGSTGNIQLNQPIVAMAPTSDGKGYWLVAKDGGVFSFGDAQFYGSTGNIQLNQPIVAMAPTSDGKGYWLVAKDGGVFSFGDAQFYGSVGGLQIPGSVVGMAVTPNGGGYWMTTDQGAVFAFGDAKFGGSMAGVKLAQPVVAIATTADGRGYWLVAKDGGIFSFGDAQFYGSMGATHLNMPMVSMLATPTGHGYWTLASDGGVFSFGDAQFYGSTGNIQLNQPIVGAAILGALPFQSLLGPDLSSSRTVSIFYYPWWGTQPPDLTWMHWNQNNHNPSVNDVASNFFPLGGPYTETYSTVVDRQMSEIAGARINQIISSWWGQGSIEDQRLSTVVPSARAHGISVAIQIENYAGRSTTSVLSDIRYLQSKWGISDIYIWDTSQFTSSQWDTVTSAISGIHLFATGDPGQMETGSFEAWAEAAGMQGVYTYDVYDELPSAFAPTCTEAHVYGLLCAPSVGPGFIDSRANNDTRYRSRGNGATYDSLWQGALTASPDLVTIVSYNEWHEGTQIEPAQAECIPGYCYKNYNGAWGEQGSTASYGYLNRTAYWAQLFMNGL